MLWICRNDRDRSRDRYHLQSCCITSNSSYGIQSLKVGKHWRDICHKLILHWHICHISLTEIPLQSIAMSFWMPFFTLPRTNWIVSSTDGIFTLNLISPSSSRPYYINKILILKFSCSLSNVSMVFFLNAAILPCHTMLSFQADYYCSNSGG